MSHTELAEMMIKVLIEQRMPLGSGKGAESKLASTLNGFCALVGKGFHECYQALPFPIEVALI